MAAAWLAVAAAVCGLLPAARVRADGSGLCPPGHFWGRAGSDPPSCKQYATPSIVDFGSFKANTVVQRFANNQLLQVPVGGELYIKLSSNRITGAQSDLVPVLNNEEYGLPEFSSHTADGWFHMKARQAHGGEEYKVCARIDIKPEAYASFTSEPQTFKYNKLFTCIRIRVLPHTATFVANTPPQNALIQAYFGESLSLDLVINSTITKEVDGVALADPCQSKNGNVCYILSAGSECKCSIAACTGECLCLQDCAQGPYPSIQAVAAMSSPVKADGLPEGASLQLVPGQLPLHRPQTWRFTWRPRFDQRSSVPTSVCFQGHLMTGEVMVQGRHGPSESYAPLPGELRCFRILVPKCYHQVKDGETLQDVARIYRSDWLGLLHNNPNLPGSNPSAVIGGQILRVGVSHMLQAHDVMDGVAVIASRFLVSPEDMLFLNPELQAHVSLGYHPHGSTYQVDLTVVLRRIMSEGEAISLSLPFLNGASWEGQVPESCTDLHYVWNAHVCQVGQAPGEECGAGHAGTCTYDHVGVLGCNEPVCPGVGEHPHVGKASWDLHTHTLTLFLAKEVEKGSKISAVIAASRGLQLEVQSTAGPMDADRPNMRGHAPSHVLAEVPIRDWVPDKHVYGASSRSPLCSVDKAGRVHCASPATPGGHLERLLASAADQRVPMELCLVLPLCADGLACAYGSDCSIEPPRA